MAKKNDTPAATEPSPGRRFECPASRNGTVLLWRPDGWQKRVRFLGGFFATSDPDEIAALEHLASTGQVVEVPYETSRPTRPPAGEPKLPASYSRPAPEE